MFSALSLSPSIKESHWSFTAFILFTFSLLIYKMCSVFFPLCEFSWFPVWLIHLRKWLVIKVLSLLLCLTCIHSDLVLLGIERQIEMFYLEMWICVVYLQCKTFLSLCRWQWMSLPPFYSDYQNNTDWKVCWCCLLCSFLFVLHRNHSGNSNYWC